MFGLNFSQIPSFLDAYISLISSKRPKALQRRLEDYSSNDPSQASPVLSTLSAIGTARVKSARVVYRKYDLQVTRAISRGVRA